MNEKWKTLKLMTITERLTLNLKKLCLQNPGKHSHGRVFHYIVVLEIKLSGSYLPLEHVEKAWRVLAVNSATGGNYEWKLWTAIKTA